MRNNELDIFPYYDIDRVEGRVVFNGKVRGDTRSSIGVSPDGSDVKQVTLRLPETNGNAKDLQSQLLLIARRHFGQQVGCYVRDSGSRIHIKYPRNGTLTNYPIDDFCTDLDNFITEVISKEIV
jgi:hypothetical protein